MYRWWWSYHSRTRRTVAPEGCNPGTSFNDLAQFTPAQIEWLANRGLVFLTEVGVSPHAGHFGAIVAASFDEACRTAIRRHPDERVLGRMQPGFVKRDWCHLQSRHRRFPQAHDRR